MNKTFYYSAILILISACSSKQPVSYNIQDDVRRYKYIHIANLMSSHPIVDTNGTHMSGEYYSPEVTSDPRSIITEVLENEGFELIQDVYQRLERIPETLILNYESYRKSNGKIEVKITFVTAATKSFVCSCNSLAKETTDTKTVQKAIQSCMKSILSKPIE